jgi:peptidoglycan/LPS O-acetylase OafA/YrhL
MPNIIDTIYRATPIPYTDQTWSVGVEEQFYFIWPWLVKYSKNLMKTLIYIIVFYFIIKFSLEFLSTRYPDNAFFDNDNYFWTFFCIDDIALGGLMACILYYNKEKALKFLFNKYVQIITYVALAIITVKGIAVPHVTYEVYAIFFAIMIINLAANPKTIISFENKILSYLGKITYGLYLYHYIAIVIAIKLGLRYVDKNNLMLSNVVYYAVTFGLCILMAVLSYEFFEKRFLRAKVKFSTIVSGDNAKEQYEAEKTSPEANDNTYAAPGAVKAVPVSS